MKKNIDSLFKKNLDVPRQVPPDSWDYIQNHLPTEEDDKKIIPFFNKKTLGIGLLLLVGGAGMFIGGNQFFNPETKQQNQSHNITGFGQIGNATTSDSNSTSNNRIGIDENSVNHQIQTIDRSDVDKGEFHSINDSDNVLTNSVYTALNNRSNMNQSNNGFYTDYSNSQNSNNLFQPFETTFGQNFSVGSIVSNGLNQDFNFTDKEDLKHHIFTEDNVAINTKTEKNKSNTKKIQPKIEFDKFYISGFVSPTGLNTFVGNSMLSDGLNDYKTENTISLAYGLKAAYSLSPKLKIRSGVSVVDFEQITKNVLFSVDLSGDQTNPSTAVVKDNIVYNGNLRLFDEANGSELSYRVSDGDVQQQTRFIEIPVEAELSLFKTGSIGISATGGGSAWLLSKNKIYAQTDGLTQELGKADNLNKTSFSANAGLKFDMQLSDGIQLNVEPNFKYLINPVNNIEKYSPYTVGVNAGVTIRLK